MEQSINDLFSVILNSEKAASEEKEKYEKVTDQIKLTAAKLEKLKASNVEYRDRIQQLEQGLISTKVGMGLLESKEEFLSNHLSMVKSDIQLYRDKLNQARELFESSSKNFISKASDFTHNYSLSSLGREKRELEAKTTIKSVDSQRELFVQEIQDLQQQISVLEDLADKMNKISEVKNSLLDKKMGVEQEIEIKRKELIQLKDQHDELASIPKTGEEFLALNAEISLHDTSEIEARAEDLFSELNDVTHAVKQMEEQQLRQQYKQWSRQQQLLHKGCKDNCVSCNENV